MADRRCTFKQGQWNCGSYQFNLYKDDIAQGDLCDVHYWQDRAQRAEAQPQQEAIYGMNQDDWKDVVAAISKVRDGRGIYLACRPADVFQEWFLALGTAKLKETT